MLHLRNSMGMALADGGVFDNVLISQSALESDDGRFCLSCMRQADANIVITFQFSMALTGA